MYVLLALLAASPGPTAPSQVQVSGVPGSASWKQLPSCAADGGNALNFNDSTQAFSCGAISAASAGSPGGNTTEFQYNNAGAFGGVASVETDGTNLITRPSASAPSTPSSGVTSWAWRPVSTFPSVPNGTDTVTGNALPTGAIGAWFTQFSTANNWVPFCHRPISGTATIVATNYGAVTGTGIGSVSWATTNLLSRLRWVSFTTSAAINQNSGARAGNGHSWRGNTAGAGGFLFWMRVAIISANTGQRTAFGLFQTTGIFAASGEPSAVANSVYVGCDSTATNLSICSNDNTGSATCTTLGSSFPCATANAMYDIWFYAAPNASGINYYIERLDSAATTSGTVSSDLPQTSVQLNWHFWGNSGPTTAAVINTRFGGACVADNL